MKKLECCADCEHHNSFYGCMKLDDCEVYQDLKAEAECDRRLEEDTS